MPLQPAKAPLAVTAIALIGTGAFFLLLRPPFLPEDLRFIGATESDLHVAAPKLFEWLGLVFRVMGGFATATGLLLLGLVRPSDRGHLRPLTVILVVIAGVISVGLMTDVNFRIGSDFKWVILALGGLWAAGVARIFWSMTSHSSYRN